MATLSAFKFDSPGGAEQMLSLVQDLAKKQVITLQDAAIVTWQAGNKKPKTKQLENVAGTGALSGAFWGMLFGLIFFVPFFGMAIGAAMGALTGKFNDYGIDDNFIKTVGQKVTPGSSALFLMTSNAVMDKVADEVKSKGWKFEILSTNLSKEQEEQLGTDFGIA
jgi:uncharacterized membrane protein